MHSTVTVLLPLATKIAIGFNEKKPASRTATVSLDISKSFDSISHDLLLEKISTTTLHSNIIRWLLTYLRGRTAVCLFQGVTSSQWTCHSGVPQGLVLSPYLFSFFISNFPDLAQLNLAYADDKDIAKSSPDVTTLGPNQSSQ
jgi:retron-type reverse transcriptase